MTLLEDRDGTNIPHRTWRDLPASPPVGDIFAQPDPSTAAGTQFAPPVATPIEVDTITDARPPRRRRTLAIAAGIVAVAAIGVAAVAALGHDGNAAATTPTIGGPEAGSPAAVAAVLGPAVVQIEVGGGIGSGVIYDTSGLILTVHHVVAGADEVTVRTADNRELPGRVVGRIPERDLAIVSVGAVDGLVAATIAEPGTVEVGETAIALGSPYGFQASVTSGIISGLDRELETPNGTLTGLIQTDAPINQGNSGGPLADAEARVIGINTAIASLSGGNDGVGFAIPVEDFAELRAEVEANGGADAPTVPAPDTGGGPFDDIPGLDELPSLDDLEELLPELEELFPELQDWLDQLEEATS